MQDDQQTHRRPTRFGRAKWGQRRIPALGIAIPVGIIFSAAFAMLTAWLGVVDGHPLLIAFVFGIVLVLPLVALVYAIVVDRQTIAGALERPEESIEQHWYHKATSRALTDLVLVAGLLLVVLVFLDPVFLDLRFALVGVIVFVMISTAARYVMQRQAGA